MTFTKKELKKYLKDLVKKQTGVAGFSFEYQSGHSAYHTRLKILITSEKIEHRRIQRGTPVDSPEEANATKVQEKEFSVEELTAFVEELMKNKIWDLENCTERALPDTALLSFTIKDNDDVVFEQKVWQSCRNDDSRTKELIRCIASIIPLNWSPP
ncbi:MAG: hypothetical protein ACFFE2_10230 [Candidatus Thorarchaeota archaeon]